MEHDPDVPDFEGIYGVKIGSKYTVVYDGHVFRRELTCVRVKPTDMEEGVEYTFSTEAEGWAETRYPLKQGVPRNDAAMPIAQSIRLTNRYANWLLRDIPEDSGIVVSLPLIRAKEGLEALKYAIKQTKKGQRGIRFFSEAWGAALGTIPIREAVGTNVLTLNFGSSTVEVALYAAKRRIEENVYTFGGSEIDKRLMNAIMQTERGARADEDGARRIKEQYSWTKNNDVGAVLTLEGSKYEAVIKGDVIREIVSNAMDQIVTLVSEQFLRAAEMKNPAVVSSLQAAGRGYVILCGGMVNMEGFAGELYQRLVDCGAINKDNILEVPEDGVIAPAIGAWKVGQRIEFMRTSKGAVTWDELTSEPSEVEE